MKSCPRGGFPIVLHNEICDVAANRLTEACHDILVDPDLQLPLARFFTKATSNKTAAARLDITANGFWGGHYERTHLDVRVISLHGPSKQKKQQQYHYLL